MQAWHNISRMDTTAITTLLDDPALLKHLLAQRTAEIAVRDKQLAQCDATIEQIKRGAVDALEAQRQKHQAELEVIFRRFYGPKSARFDPSQLLLFGLVIGSLPIGENAVAAESGEPLNTRRIQHKHGRAKLSECLPRIPIEHDLTEQEKLWAVRTYDTAARRTARLYSLIASAERHGIDPQAYLTGVLARIASMPVSQLDKLLPERWK